MNVVRKKQKKYLLIITIIIYSEKMVSLNVINVIGVKYDVIDICQVALYTWTL